MGYIVFWVEVLAAALLLIAAVMAWSARLPRAGPAAVPVLVALLLFALAGAALFVTGFFTFGNRFDFAATGFYAVLVWTVLFLVGAVAVLVAGRKRKEGVRVAQTWPRGRLALCLAAALVLAAITFTNLDLAVRVRLASVRAEAGARALALAPPHISERDNAAPVYRDAFAALTAGNQLPAAWQEKLAAWTALDDKAFDAKDADVAAYLKSQQPALALFRRAAALPGCRFERDFTRSIDLLLPELDHLKRGASLLALDARCRAAEGDGRAALDDVAALFGMAHHIEDPILISLIVAAQIEETAIRTLEAILPLVTPRPEDLARLSLPRENAYRTQMHRGFQMEEAALGLSCFVMLAEGGSAEWDRGFDELLGSTTGRPVLASPLYRVFFLESDLAAYRRTMGEMSEISARPYHESRPEWQELHQSFRTNRRGILTALLVPAGERCAERAAEVDATCQVARAGVAALAYRGKTGKYPEKLKDLVPAYLPQVPTDPFDGQPLRSKRDGDGVVIYSVGPNLRDDGGIAGTKTEGDIVFRLR